MTPYWTLFTFAALFSLRDLPLPVLLRGKAAHLTVIVVAIAIMVGLRYKVGGDWGNYQRYLLVAQTQSLGDALTGKDPSYQLLNWLGSQSGEGIWPVNLVCGSIFCFGLWRFARTLPSPSLAILVAIPYLVIVVAMGYSRQAAAIGFVMAGLSALRSGRYVNLAFMLILAVSFHRTALIIMPIMVLSRARNRIPLLAGFGLLAVALYYAFLDSTVDQLVNTYVEQEYESSGAAIRVVMNAIPAALFLVLGRRFPLANEDEHRFWRNIAIAALVCVPSLAIVGSTAVDRLALYLIPLQMFVLSWLPLVLGNSQRDSKPVVAAIMLYSAAIQGIWFGFASHSYAWIPYQFIPFSNEKDVFKQEK